MRTRRLRHTRPRGANLSSSKQQHAGGKAGAKCKGQARGTPGINSGTETNSTAASKRQHERSAGNSTQAKIKESQTAPFLPRRWQKRSAASLPGAARGTTPRPPAYASDRGGPHTANRLMAAPESTEHTGQGSGCKPDLGIAAPSPAPHSSTTDGRIASAAATQLRLRTTASTTAQSPSSHSHPTPATPQAHHSSCTPLCRRPCKRKRGPAKLQPKLRAAQSSDNGEQRRTAGASGVLTTPPTTHRNTPPLNRTPPPTPPAGRQEAQALRFRVLVQPKKARQSGKQGRQASSKQAGLPSGRSLP